MFFFDKNSACVTEVRLDYSDTHDICNLVVR